jgi:NAD(P)-dependent dehydrogenase (short-subunit alcohol dehydrogenase family)
MRLHTAPIEAITAEVWNDILAVNLSAAFHTMRHALPHMAEASYGRVSNIASVKIRSRRRCHSPAGANIFAAAAVNPE